MRVFANVLAFMPLFVVVVAGRLHGHHGPQRLARRDVETSMITETITVFETVTVDPAPALIATTNVADFSVTTAISSSTSTSIALDGSSSTAPSATPATSPALTPIANSAMVVNSCSYPVYIWSVRHPACAGEVTDGKLIDPNGIHTEVMHACDKGGVALKISKTKDMDKPVQFEYSVWPTDQSLVSYDISFLNCMNKGLKDLADCAGSEGGIKAVGGGDCPDYHCLPGQWCDEQAYVAEEFDYKPNAPVGDCKVDKGIAFELCAGPR